MASFAYLHCTPDGTPFYVGKGALRRVKYLGGRNAKHQEIGTHSAAIIYALKHTCVVKGRTVAEAQNGS